MQFKRGTKKGCGAIRLSPTWLQFMKKLRKKVAKIQRKNNGQHSWLSK